MPTIIVPKTECPLNILAKLSPAIKNAEILIDYTVEQVLTKSANQIISDNDSITFCWNATDKYSPSSLKLEKHFVNCNRYSRVLEINSERIAFKKNPDVPGFTIYLKME